jgi:tellurium resistance protein TerD
LKADGNVLSDKYFIFFNNKKSPDGVVVHQGDNLTGAGSGDDEVIFVDLNRMKTEALRIVFVVTIYQAEARKQDFGQVDNAFIRIVNRDTNQELARYDLGKEFSHETSMLFGDVYREGNEWHFRAVGEGYKGGLGEAARNFGVNVK